MRWENPIGYDGYIDIMANASVFDSSAGQPRIIPFKRVFWQYFPPVDIPVAWGNTNRLRIEVEVKYKLRQKRKGFTPFSNPLPWVGVGKLRLWQEWFIYYPKEGLLINAHVRGGSEVEKRKGDVVVHISSDDFHSPQDLKGPFVLMDMLMSVVNTDSSLSVGVAYGSVGIEKEFGGSSDVESRKVQFRGNIGVIGRPAPIRTPTPKPKPFEVPEDLLTHNVYFDSEGLRHITTDGLRRLEDKWHDPILRQMPKLHEAIKNGKCPVYLDGYASDTGKDTFNDGLTEARVESVEKAIKKNMFKSQKVDVVLAHHGESKVTQTGAAAQERWVKIQINKHDAVKAITPSQRCPI